MPFSTFANDYGGEFVPDPALYTSKHARLFCISSIEVVEEFLDFSNDLNESYRSDGHRGVNIMAGYLLGRPGDPKRKLINAHARYQEGIDYVGIYISLAASTWKMIAAIVENGFMSIFMGEADQPRINDVYSDVIVDIHSQNEFGLSELSEDLSDFDFDLIKIFFKSTLHWIFQHEFSHIWCGHAEYLANKRDGKDFDELSDEENFAVEVFCDDRATIAHVMNEYPLAEVENITKKVIDSRVMNLNQFSFNIIVSLLSFEISFLIFALREKKSLTHPMSRTRRNRVIRYFELFFEDNLIFWNSYSFRKYMLIYILPFYLHKSFGSDNIPDSFTKTIAPSDYDYDVLDPNWEIVAKKLAPYFRGEKAYLALRFGAPDRAIDKQGRILE
ncbi:hypothetical protein [Sphingobium nicotianae]|uniref:Uncharacterized protein n=1 Tax=Sphingobium nicotianae TaxID=2782607 RepID=A0A9X1IP38_9SPHN|nr:hypothetical protein [Sphingobium nicotianae]MBT2185953.1 hypothetical protein [Sphingobium nicotianae]